MIKYAGNIASLIDCDQLIKDINKFKDIVEIKRGPGYIAPGEKFHDKYLDLMDKANKAGYFKGNGLEFRHYEAGKHYDDHVSAVIGEVVGATCLSSFISEIRPGKCVPCHRDILKYEATPEKYNNALVRYACFIDKPKVGHAFLIEETCFYMVEQGAIYQFPKLDSWHAGLNAGLEPKFIMTWTGYRQ